MAIDGGRVTFHWKDYAHRDQQRTMTLSAMEFLCLFVQLILPGSPASALFSPGGGPPKRVAQG